jgi:hypothetical protein
MFIMNADVQHLFSTMTRDTLKRGTVGRKAKGHLDRALGHLAAALYLLTLACS